MEYILSDSYYLSLTLSYVIYNLKTQNNSYEAGTIILIF